MKITLFLNAAALIASGAAAAPTAAAVSAEAITTDSVAAERLLRALIVAATSLPETADARAYEATFALEVDRSTVTCDPLLRVMDRALVAPMSKPAHDGLRNLRASLAGCRPRGTRGGPGDGFALAQVPGFSVGGGSDYTR